MASQLREVLNHFSDQSAPISLTRMAREMNLQPGVLQGMIEYWVRKGKLREVNTSGDNCTTCGVKGACPFIVNLPRYYELADNSRDSIPPCSCGGTCVS
ncbi:MAG: hypothetical protein KC496_16370 [Anaerolineae bacterium]|nr:hypothetical protein [Anaerolineae bacterium]